jgi:HPr kinase/phosphorylase
MKQITADRLFKDREGGLELEQLTSTLESLVPITVSDINRPGLAMAGYTENFLNERIQVIGETEIGLLASYKPKEREVALDRLFQFQVPCIAVSKSLEVPPSLLERAD